MKTNLQEGRHEFQPYQAIKSEQEAQIQQVQNQFTDEPNADNTANQTTEAESFNRSSVFMEQQGFIFPISNSNLPLSPMLPFPPIPTIHQIGSQFLPPPPPPPPPPPFFNEFYTRRALQFAYDGAGVATSSSDPFGLAGFYMNSDAFLRGGFVSSASSPFVGKMTAQEIMDAKALAASKSHSEAERRRRERINGHLAKLRSMLPNTTKTDKASLLAEVIQHVKELKRQTSEIAEESPLPTESDELTVDDLSSEDEGRFIVRASLCCEDRSELLPDLIRTLKSLRLRALKAEITTLAGRVKNVLLVTGEEESMSSCNPNFDGDDCIDNSANNQSENQLQQVPHQHSLASIQEALRAVMERTVSSDEGSGGSTKRQRTANLSSIVDHRSI